ncbi:MAG: arylsulfatase AtsA [Saprospiraceae bacterium]
MNNLEIPSKSLILFYTFSVLWLSSCQFSEVSNSRPNILLILADDLGYGDLSCYGGDIQTPNLDAIAAAGLRFSHFHTAPMCAPTRAMLLSGNDNHIAGMGRQARVSEDFGFEGRLTDRIVTIPQLLRDTGYHTYMAGKWHLGRTAAANPAQKGFERSFALHGGAGNHYTNQGALRKGLSKYTEDGDSTSWIDGNYSTDFYTDKLIQYIDHNRDDGKPFFAYAAYTSPHWPLQVDREHWEKYKGQYDSGYEALRLKRFNSLKKMGIVPEEATLPALHPSVQPWDSLSTEEQRKEARKMELYAGMVDNLDHNIGRLINYLKETGQYENTFIVFMSDNGAAPRDFIKNEHYKFLREYYNDDYERMGEADSYISYGPQWAEAGAAPFRYYKNYATEGGTNTTLIVSGPQVKAQQDFYHGFTSLLDLAPTFYDLAKTTYPESYQGKPIYPLLGRSLLPFLTGKEEKIHNDDYVFAIEHGGNAMVRKGDWKITNFSKPYNTENFGLYDLSKDIGEQTDLREQYPEKYLDLLKEWSAYAEKIKLPEEFR